MAGPAWLAGALAVVMIVIAVYFASRLALSLLRRRETEADADGVHAVMGVAMAGMLAPRLSPLAASMWEPVFGIAAAWFAWQVTQTRRGNARATWRCSHPLPHLGECAAMLYMLLAVPGSRAAGSGPETPMSGMGGSAGAGASLQAVAVVLALFMVGYVVWATDQLTLLARGGTARTPRTTLPAEHPGVSGALGATGSEEPLNGPGISTAVAPPQAEPAGGTMLAPRLAACSKIAMGLIMGYMLILML